MVVPSRRRLFILLKLLTGIAMSCLFNPLSAAAVAPTATLNELLSGLKGSIARLQEAPGPRRSFQALAQEIGLPDSAYADFVVVRTLFEASRDAGFWNLGWTITDLEPNSDAIWSQWAAADAVDLTRPIAWAECDELSALLGFLTRKMGVHGVGLLWPTANHTVAVWAVPNSKPPARLLIPTTQIFLGPGDRLGTRSFDPWRQRSIYPYERQDVGGDFVLPRNLVKFFLIQIERYGAATDETLQDLRYLREAVFREEITATEAGRQALAVAARLELEADIRALRQFARDMGVLRSKTD